MKRIYISLALLALIAVITGLSALLNPQIISKITPQKVNSAEPPIILIHGFNQSSDFWEDIHLIHALKEKNIIHMGNYHSNENLDFQLFNATEIAKGQTALYTLSLPEKGTKDIRASGIFLGKIIRTVTTRHQCENVRLIAFSAGGIVSREYLTTNYQRHQVASLTTVSTPHLGSEHAWLCVSYHQLLSLLKDMQTDTSGNILTQNTRKITTIALKSLTYQIQQWSHEFGIDISSQCALMLAEPENGNYLDTLSKAPHPTNITYHCIMTEENILNYDLQKLKHDFDFIRSGDFTSTTLADNLLDLARNALGKLDNLSSKLTKLKFHGDGVVSKHSQNLNNIAAFQNNSNLTSTTTELISDHGNPAITNAILKTLP